MTYVQTDADYAQYNYWLGMKPFFQLLERGERDIEKERVRERDRICDMLESGRNELIQISFSTNRDQKNKLP